MFSLRDNGRVSLISKLKIQFFRFYFSRHLFIGNLCNVTIESLRLYCEKYGSINDLSLNRDKDNNVNNIFLIILNIYIKILY